MAKPPSEKPRVGTKTIVPPPVTVETTVYAVEFVNRPLRPIGPDGALVDGPAAVVKLRSVQLDADGKAGPVLADESVEIPTDAVAAFLDLFASTTGAEKDLPWWKVREKRVDEWLAAQVVP